MGSNSDRMMDATSQTALLVFKITSSFDKVPGLLQVNGSTGHIEYYFIDRTIDVIFIINSEKIIVHIDDYDALWTDAIELNDPKSIDKLIYIIKTVKKRCINEN